MLGKGKEERRGKAFDGCERPLELQRWKDSSATLLPVEILLVAMQ
jgi:hypothetical protein